MYIIKSSIKVKDKELIQIQYITENFMVIELGNQKHLYIPGNNLFVIDSDNKKLKELDFSAQINQMNNIRPMLGEIKSIELLDKKEILGIQSRGLKFYNNSDSMKFEMISYIVSIPGIENTVYPEFMNNEQNKQIVKLNLNTNEIIGSSFIKIYTNGTLIQEQSIIILEVEKDLDDIKEFYEYLTYSHE